MRGDPAELRAALTKLLYETDGTADHILEVAPLYGISIAASPAPDPERPALDVERRCPHCKLTATRIGEIHINAQEIIERGMAE